MSLSDDELTEQLRDAYNPTNEPKPHRQLSVLILLLHEHGFSHRDTALILRDTFKYKISHEAVRQAAQQYGVAALTDGEIGTVISDTDDTEPGQPSVAHIRDSRSDDISPNPLETPLFKCAPIGTAEGGTLPTLHKSTHQFTQSTTSRPNTTDLSSDHLDTRAHLNTPSAWRVRKVCREYSLIAPPYAAESDTYADAYVACGCGDCRNSHYLDGETGGAPTDCPNSLPVTLGGARRIYRHLHGANIACDRQGNPAYRARKQYAKIMRADSALMRASGPDPLDDDTDGGFTSSPMPMRIEEKTTILISLRQSPTKSGLLVTPYTLLRDLKNAWGEARDYIPRDCGDRLMGYIWTLTGTEEWATPHVHCYLYYHDAEDEVTHEDFAPLVHEFISSSTYAATDAHLGADCSDGETITDSRPTDADIPLADGVVSIEHDPLRVNPDHLATDVDTDNVFKRLSRDPRGVKRLSDGDIQTRGAVYVASQLPGWALVGGENPAHAEFAAAADALNDNRPTSRSSRRFYHYANTLDTLREFESLA